MKSHQHLNCALDMSICYSHIKPFRYLRCTQWLDVCDNCNQLGKRNQYLEIPICQILMRMGINMKILWLLLTGDFFFWICNQHNQGLIILFSLNLRFFYFVIDFIFKSNLEIIYISYSSIISVACCSICHLVGHVRSNHHATSFLMY